MNPTVAAALISAVSAIGVALIGRTVSKNNKKDEKERKNQLAIQQETKKIIADFKEENRKENQKILQSIKEDRLMNDKRWLLDFLTRVQNGEKMSEEQIYMAYETKERYNNNGGDSYIDDLWEKNKELDLF